ncbi:MAG: hypothetical protein CMF69_02815, partial [Magnetovibrio sp.]|nr:hypothetical protein [Magnetovibrio sp.]
MENIYDLNSKEVGKGEDAYYIEFDEQARLIMRGEQATVKFIKFKNTVFRVDWKKFSAAQMVVAGMREFKVEWRTLTRAANVRDKGEGGGGDEAMADAQEDDAGASKMRELLKKSGAATADDKLIEKVYNELRKRNKLVYVIEDGPPAAGGDAMRIDEAAGGDARAVLARLCDILNEEAILRKKYFSVAREISRFAQRLRAARQDDVRGDLLKSLVEKKKEIIKLRIELIKKNKEKKNLENRKRSLPPPVGGTGKPGRAVSVVRLTMEMNNLTVVKPSDADGGGEHARLQRMQSEGDEGPDDEDEDPDDEDEDLDDEDED